MRSNPGREDRLMSNAKWYESDGKNHEIVLSSKAVITRNLKGYKFPSKMDLTDKDEVISKVSEALSDRNLKLYALDGMSDSERDDLIDSQVYSDSGLFEDFEGKALLVNEDKSLSVLLNDKDHIKIKAQASGYTNSVYKMCEDFACDIEKKMDVAFSSKYGYLGSSVQNTGLGFRLLYTIAIPGIVRTGDGLEILAEKVKSLDWHLYPFIQQDRQMKCDVFIISSTTALGADEATVLMSGDRLIKEIIKIENICRDNLRKSRNDLIENNFYRSYGILYYSKLVDPFEALDLLSWIRLYHGFENRNEVSIDWRQINTMTSQLLWSVLPQRSKGGNYTVDGKYLAARIARILRNQ